MSENTMTTTNQDFPHSAEFERWYLSQMEIPLAPASWKRPGYGDMHLVYRAFAAGLIFAGLEVGLQSPDLHKEFERWYFKTMGVPLAPSWRNPAYGDQHVLHRAFVAGAEVGINQGRGMSQGGCMPAKPSILAADAT